MSFNADRFAAKLRRLVESRDPLRVRAELDKYLAKWGTQEHVRMRIARALVNEELEPFRVAELIGAAIGRHDLVPEHKYYVHNRGAFVASSIFREMSRAARAEYRA